MTKFYEDFAEWEAAMKEDEERSEAEEDLWDQWLEEQFAKNLRELQEARDAAAYGTAQRKILDTLIGPDMTDEELNDINVDNGEDDKTV